MNYNQSNIPAIHIVHCSNSFEIGSAKHGQTRPLNTSYLRFHWLLEEPLGRVQNEKSEAL